ncbi:MAG: sugar phosphate isomerase/epimerase [Clostridiales bacterium]|jgi:sugar phosphate isomerase/epimerase|nr:sugar phosphate isomerase/epimerase [Clostridiales bacterium]
MNIGISTASLFNKYCTEDCFEVLADIGCRISEVFFNTYSEYGAEFAKKLKGRLNGVKVHSVHALGTQFEPELFSINGRVRNDAESVLKKVMESAVTLGAGYYTFHGQYRMKRFKSEINLDALGAGVNRVIDIAEGFGITVSYENVHYAYSAEPDFFRIIKERCPRLAFTLDVKQAMQAYHLPREYLKTMGGSISTVHVCDVTADNVPVLPGRGVVDFKEFFAELSGAGVDVPVLLEVYADNYRTADELRGCFELIKKLAE